MSPTTTRDLRIKWTVYALAIALLLFLHTLTTAHVRVQGVVPFLPPLLLAVVASMEERLESAVFALVFGVLCDLALTAPVPWLYTVSFIAAALLVSLIARSVVQPGFLCSLVSSAVAFALIDLILAAVLLLAGRSSLAAILDRALRELLLSLPLLAVCHPLLAFLHRRFTL